jgi:hypothetical protein
MRARQSRSRYRVAGVVKSVLFALVGAVMITVGVWGLAGGRGVGSGKAGGHAPSLLAPVKAPPTSSARECARVGARDSRFLVPHDIRSGAEGRATVQCRGAMLTFSIELSAAKPHTFYDVVLERGGRAKQIGGFLAFAAKDSVTAGVSSELDTTRYDFLTVRETDFGAGTVIAKPVADLHVAFRGAL